MQATIVTIGDEILIGQIIDTNSAWMGTELNLLGINVKEIISISDDHQQIIDTIGRAIQSSDLVLLTGGLGPTKDDITKKAIADYLKVEMEFHEPTWNRIQKFFQQLGRETTPAHKEQCFIPKTAAVLLNKMGTAPGMWFEIGNSILVSMPGVPYEMKYLMTHEVLPKFSQKLGDQHIIHRTILTAGEGESRIAAKLESFENILPNNFKLAYLPNLGMVRLRLTGVGKNKTELEKEIERLKENLVQRIPQLVFGFEKETLAEVVGKLLIERKKKLGAAESCTGGYLSHLITQVPGSSGYFQGAIIAYENSIKENQLGVLVKTLREHGAVSAECVTEMAQGAIKKLNVDMAIAISGIAGPGGGTEEKPVGTIWLAVADRSSVQTNKLTLFKDRLKNIEYTGNVGLNMLRLFLLEAK